MVYSEGAKVHIDFDQCPSLRILRLRESGDTKLIAYTLLNLRHVYFVKPGDHLFELLFSCPRMTCLNVDGFELLDQSEYLLPDELSFSWTMVLKRFFPFILKLNQIPMKQLPQLQTLSLGDVHKVSLFSLLTTCCALRHLSS
ncbi:hypothetical protein RCL1_000738 [Eukaryota sp. TZLM3-RCL]